MFVTWRCNPAGPASHSLLSVPDDLAARSATAGAAPEVAQTDGRKWVNDLNRTTGVFAAAAALACSAALFTSQARAEEKQLTVAMITHAQPGDTFWDIIRKGAEAAAKKDNVKLIYVASPDATKEAQLIQNMTEQHV